MKTPEEIVREVRWQTRWTPMSRTEADALDLAVELGIAEERKKWLSKDENGDFLVPADNNDLIVFGEKMLDSGILIGKRELAEELITGK